MSGKEKKRGQKSRPQLSIMKPVNDERVVIQGPSKGCPLGMTRNPFKTSQCLPNWALRTMDYTVVGEDLRNKIRKIQASRKANSAASGALHFSRQPQSECLMNEDEIRDLWMMLFLKNDTEDTVCAALQKSLILPSRPIRLINHGGYGTTLELASGQVTKIVPVSTQPDLIRMERFSQIREITPVEEAQYEAYMLHYVSKLNVVRTPKLFQFFMIQPHQSVNHRNTKIHEWRNAVKDPSLDKVRIEPGNVLQLAVFIMSKAEGKTLKTEFEEFAKEREMGWLTLDWGPSNQTLDNYARLLTTCLKQIGAMHRAGIIHGDCHLANILCETDMTKESFDLNSDVITFIDWARSMRKKDFRSQQFWNNMCVYDFAQFLRSFKNVVGGKYYETLLKMSFNLLSGDSEAKAILRQEWFLYPERVFRNLVEHMFDNLFYVQNNAKQKSQRKEE